MSPRVYRNAPCPCGSGKKYKQCHGRGGASLTRPLRLPLWAMVGTVVVVVGAVALLFTASRNPSPRLAPGPSALPPAGATASSPAPAPYEYDRVGNRYWDPSHQHWHNGPPPDSLARAAASAPVTAAPAPSATPTDSARR